MSPNQNSLCASLLALAFLMLAPDHTRTAYDTELHGLSFLLTEMGGVAETQVMGVATALQNGDRNRAVQLIEADLLIDRFQTRVEESAVKIIACHQPVANDLRRVIATLHSVRRCSLRDGIQMQGRSSRGEQPLARERSHRGMISVLGRALL